MRDVEAVGRLRTALLLDKSLNREKVFQAVKAIDDLQSLLSGFSDLASTGTGG
jgi:hypothetical protein